MSFNHYKVIDFPSYIFAHQHPKSENTEHGKVMCLNLCVQQNQ